MTSPRLSTSHRESRDRDLRDLDFLALAFVLGLLVLLFRQIERWLHQHIFKVGWLLTNDVQITTVLYYIIFLPGILLRELTLWLAASVLNVRAEGQLQFPQEQDISALRLSFIRLAPATSNLKLILISLSPLGSALAALWAISVTLFPVGESLALALPSSVTELGAAITALTRTANFWLWLYIVFTIANRSFPTLPMKLSARQKFLLTMTLPALCFGLWRASDVVNPAIALGIEGLLRGLTLIIAQITLLNIGCVLVLGAIEAVIESITGRNATFRDGRMITTGDEEAAPAQAGMSKAGQKAPKRTSARNSAPATSIYDLKLPVPGPPGREPVSRQAVAVVNLERPAADDDVPRQEVSAQPAPVSTVRRLPDAKDGTARQQPKPTSDESEDAIGRVAGHDPIAPFARPFAANDAPNSASGDWDEPPSEGKAEPFARPFVLSTGSDLPASAAHLLDSASDRSKADAETVRADSTDLESQQVRGRRWRSAGQTRPAPKPSQKVERERGSAETFDTDELEYEDLDDIDAYDQDDGAYDDEL